MNNTVLAKYLFHEATPPERERVEQWLSESPLHREEFERLQERLERATRRYRPGAFDAAEALRRVVPRRSLSRALSPRYASAAAILLLLGMTLFWAISPREVTLTTLTGEVCSFYLPDSSRVTLSGPASLSYPARFSQGSREVSSTGTAYFEVTHDPRNPFIVSTPQLHVHVLGTVFQTESDDRKTDVLVEEGRVKVITPHGKREEILTQGMAATCLQGEERITVTSFDNNRLSWKTGLFQFNSTPLPEVVRLLNNHYRERILLPEGSDTLRITVSFRGLSLEEVLEIINRTLDIQLECQ